MKCLTKYMDRAYTTLTVSPWSCAQIQIPVVTFAHVAIVLELQNCKQFCLTFATIQTLKPSHTRHGFQIHAQAFLQS